MRKRRFIALLYGCLALTVACQKAKEPSTAQQPPVRTSSAAQKPQDLSNAQVNAVLALAEAPLEKSLLGDTLGKDGNVTAQQTQFLAGQPIYLTMWVKQSPGGLQTSARWYDAKKKEVAMEARDMKGAKVVTFTMNKKLEPGKYYVAGFWGGNQGCEYDFEVLKAPRGVAKKK